MSSGTIHAGELAALGTAVCWVLSSVAFEVAGKRCGALTLNLIRLSLALVGLTIYSGLVLGQWFPVDASTHMWLWLSASSVAGFLIGDYCLIRGLIAIGSRLTTLVMATTPLWTALLGWLVLGETLTLRDAAAMLLVVGGIGWAVMDRPTTESSKTHLRRLAAGVGLATIGAIGQATGLVLSKFGMGDADAFIASQIRVAVGVLGYVCVCTVIGWWPKVVQAASSIRVMAPTLFGSLFGPFLGVALSLLAVQLARNAGVAATLMSIAPILIIPVSLARGEVVGLGGWLGACIAVAGVALLLL